jgi:hypothetical protein
VPTAEEEIAEDEPAAENELVENDEGDYLFWLFISFPIVHDLVPNLSR